MQMFHRILLFIPAMAILPVTALVAADEPSPLPTKFSSIFFDWDKLAVKPTNVGERRDVFDAPTATLQKFECHISTLNPGQMSHPPHRHPQEELIILERGALDVFINGKTQHVGPGSAFFFASNDLHNVRNVGAVPATYFVFNFATAATRTVPAQPASESAAPDKLRSSVFEWEKLPVTPTDTGARRTIIDSPTVTCINFESHATTLNPGESSLRAAHHHRDEGVIIIKEGTTEIVLNGVAHRAGAGSLAFLGSNEPHYVKNVGDTPATYYVVHFITEATPKIAAN